MTLLIKKPSAWAPIALSLAMLAFILIYIVTFGVSAPDPNADEGTPAHLFQIWLVLEAVMIPVFAIKWLPQAPKQALQILVFQVVAVLLPMAIVFSLNF